ncbi:MAG: TlpA family protein disulfide reductase [Alphaproteobacteria bacterium]|nr:TlpA family protein disulfide reductase [Alphaproteobacteria bacterium]
MRIALLALLPVTLAFTVACDTDADLDGLLKSEELELGTDPKNADSDGDGIDDGDEVLAGTMPTEADSDGDGFTDGEEAINGDALNKYHWPDGLWADFSADADITNPGWHIGEQMPDFQAKDQFGNDVSLHQFYGMVVLLDFSAGWCGPCRQLAEDAEDHFLNKRDEGFVTIHLMIQDNQGSEPNKRFLEDWADEYGITFPVVRQPGNDASNQLSIAGTDEGYIPFQIVLDQEMRIDMAFSGVPNTPVKQRINQLLEQ